MRQFIYSFFITLVLVSLSIHTQAALFQKDKTTYFPIENLPKESLVPGGIALIPFQYGRDDLPKASFLDERVMVVNVAKRQWIAVVGLSLNLKPGEYELAITRKQGVANIPFYISEKAYEEQHITLKDTKKVSPSKASLKRIGEESALMKGIFKTWNEQPLKALNMSYPVEGPLSSQFGLKRFFNKQPRNPHSGIDIASNRGSPVKNPLAGKVKATGDYYFNGNTVLIDHGQGLVTMYCHLEEIRVEQGQTVVEGDIIGTVGSSGRATGPHLHWSVNLNNTRVDPLLFIGKSSP